MNNLSSALAILSAMITPAVLISACGALTISTSARLGRVVDRTRTISEQLEALMQGHEGELFLEEERAMLFGQLGRATRRARLLQRAMASLYFAITVFVATSGAIGIVAVASQQYAWVPILFGILGAGLLFYTSLLLILESRIALTAVEEEMDFVLRLGRHHVPPGLLKERRARRWLFRRP